LRLSECPVKSAYFNSDFASTPQEQDPAHCQIHYDADEPHLRKSHNHNAVGVKPYVTCDRSVQSIILHVQIYKQEQRGPIPAD
jgi:hypothetical protein